MNFTQENINLVKEKTLAISSDFRFELYELLENEEHLDRLEELTVRALENIILRLKSKVDKKPELDYFIREITWMNNKHGWGNGYVLIPPNHKCYEWEEMDVHGDIDVHGGITFSELVGDDSFWTKTIKIDKKYYGYWCVGFDTCHFDDTKENWTEEDVENETLRLKQQIEGL